MDTEKRELTANENRELEWGMMFLRIFVVVVILMYFKLYLMPYV